MRYYGHVMRREDENSMKRADPKVKDRKPKWHFCWKHLCDGSRTFPSGYFTTDISPKKNANNVA